MASATVFLVYACSLLPLLAAHEDSKPCVFPFIYGKQSYPSCTGDGTENGKLWCATTHNYDSNPEWKWCSVQEHGGNSDGEPCFFPFVYMGKTYFTCTTKNSKVPWCATTGNYDINRKWSCCADIRETGGPCYFPFTYNGTSHTTCITDDSPKGKPWCSQTKDYDVDHRRVYCEASEALCTFPFTYKGRQYCSCTKDGATDGQYWCATTPNYDQKRKWRTCTFDDNGGNSPGKKCVLPFKYKGDDYYRCTSVDEPSGRLWCATTPSYDKDGNWTFCADPAPPATDPNHNKTCSFPFTYEGTVYSSCTKVGSFWGRLWCSLTSDFNIDHEWKYCDSSDRERGCSQQS